MAIRWRIVEPETAHWREWDGEVLLYHAASGDTHLVDALTACAIRRLGGAPATVAELAVDETIWTSSDAPETLADRTAFLDDLLRGLSEIGLAERADS